MRRTVLLEDRRTAYSGFFKVETYTFRRSRSNGEMSPEIVNEVFERGDAAAVLVRDATRDVVVLAKQFRLPAHLRADKRAAEDDGAGWILEMVAGIVDDGETPEAAGRRELLEELGYRTRALEPIAQVFASPGASTERLFLFYAEVSSADLEAPNAGGLASENEDVERVEMSVAAFLDAARSGAIVDAKTLIAAQWLQQKLGG